MTKILLFSYSHIYWIWSPFKNARFLWHELWPFWIIEDEMKSFHKPVYLILGCLFLLLGIIGVFVPLMPTTPFLIVAAFFLSRGSDRIYQWLIQHRTLGPPILDWQKNRVIRLRYKVMASGMMLITSFFIFFFDLMPRFADIVYGLFLATVLTFLWTRKSKPT